MLYKIALYQTIFCIMKVIVALQHANDVVLFHLVLLLLYVSHRYFKGCQSRQENKKVYII